MMTRKLFLLLSVLAAVALGPIRARLHADQKTSTIHLDTTSDTYVLFLDMREVESRHNVELVVDPATKHPANPIIPLGDVDEFDSRRVTVWSGSLIYDTDENVFKCWYLGANYNNDLSHCRTGYAWSRDGVYWQKPKLGLFEFGGDKENNICHLSSDAHVVKDYAEKDPQKRYKMLSHQEGSICITGKSYYPWYSPDGIHWEAGPDVQSFSKMEINQLLIDPLERNPQRRFKGYGKSGKFESKRPDLGPERTMKAMLAYGPDIEHGTLSSANPILDPDDGLEKDHHFASVFIYKSYYLLLYDYGLYQDYYGHGKFGNFAGDIRLAVSRDGEHFTRVNAHQPVVRRGERNEWDSGNLLMGSAIKFKDHVYIYYSGLGEMWSSFPTLNRASGTPKHLAGAIRPAQIGLATLRLDGFTHVQARDGFGPGIVTTVPIQVKSSDKARLCVNIAEVTPYRDWLEVEILDAKSGIPIAGYGRKDCEDVITEGVSVPVRWQGGDTLRAVSVPEIKLKFYLYGKARLHSFTFQCLR